MRASGKRAAAIGLSLLLCSSPAYPRVIDGVVAVVNEEPVTFSEVREAVAQGMGVPVGDADALLREEHDSRTVLRWIEDLVESVLVRKELEKEGQAITKAEIDRAVESVRTANKLDEKQFADLLAKDGTTLAAYRRRLQWQMERGAIVRARKYKEVTVTDVELREYYRKNMERFLKGGQVRLETLFFPIPADAAGEQAAKIRNAAQQASEAVRSGRTFDEAYGIARATVPDAKLLGGDFVPESDLLPEVQREIRRLRTGETSAAFFAESGAYIVRVDARRGGTPEEFSKVRESLGEELTDRRSEKAYADILSDLKKSASIDVRL